MSKLTKEFLSLIPLGSRLIVKDNEDGDFEGTLNTPITFESSRSFTVTLDKCRRVGSSKFQPGSQEFDSETIEDIELINDATSDQGNLFQKGLCQLVGCSFICWRGLLDRLIK